MRCTECNTIIKPVVAIDIDGTISDYHYHFLSFARLYLDLPVDRTYYMRYDGTTDLATFLGISKEHYREVKLAYRQGGQKRLQPILPGARELLQEIHRIGAEIWLTTTRPWMKFDSTNPDTIHWLEKHHIPYDHLLYDDDKYDRLHQIVGPGRVVGVLEDLTGPYRRAYDLGLNPILVRWPWNRGMFAREVEVKDLTKAKQLLTERIIEWQSE